MNTYRRALITYWLEIGKLKRVRKSNADTEWIYIFVRNDGIELKMTMSWTTFFESFHIFNHYIFMKELDSDYPEIRQEFRPWLPFDPWRNQAFIDGACIEFDFDGLGIGGGRQLFLVEAIWDGGK